MYSADDLISRWYITMKPSIRQNSAHIKNPAKKKKDHTICAYMFFEVLIIYLLRNLDNNLHER